MEFQVQYHNKYRERERERERETESLELVNLDNGPFCISHSCDCLIQTLMNYSDTTVDLQQLVFAYEVHTCGLKPLVS